MTRKNERVEVAAVLVHETEGAYLLDVGEAENVWIPKSRAEPGDDKAIWLIEEWLAEREGLI